MVNTKENSKQKFCRLIKMSPEYFEQLFFIFLTVICISDGMGTETTAITSVGGSNYTYYVLKYKGPILLKLETLQGDADLYVSEEHEHPTFDLEKHSLSSWTFGSEVIFIPKIFGRPVYIGVYGHPRYEESRYILTANFLDDEEYDPYKIQVEYDTKAQPRTSNEEEKAKTPKVDFHG